MKRVATVILMFAFFSSSLWGGVGTGGGTPRRIAAASGSEASDFLTTGVSGKTESGDKIERALFDQLTTAGTSDLIVRFFEQADLSPAYGMGWEERGEFVYNALKEVAERTQDRAKAYLDRRGLAHRSFIAGNELYVWLGDLEAANALAELPEVAFIRASRTYPLDPVSTVVEAASAPNVPQAATAWGILDTGADQFWAAFGFQGEGIVVGSIDTGVEYTHAALSANYKCGSGPHGDCWYDPVNGTTTPTDWEGHGTHNMGIVLGEDDPGLAWNVGMAPNAQWISCVGCPDLGGFSEVALNACADWMLAPGGDPNNRPHIVSNPWSHEDCDSWYLTKVSAWRAAGIFPSFSAGIGGPTCDTLRTPGEYQESFGSVAHSSSREIASFSARGPSCYGHNPYTKPNISAPGVLVMSAEPGNTWGTRSGTAFASSHTAGAVALLWSCNPALIGQMNPTFEALQDSAGVAPAGDCGAPPDGEGDYTYGYGYLDVYAAGLLSCPCDPVHDADFTWAPLVPGPGQLVAFSGSAVGSGSVFCSWDFGDHATSTQQNPVHAFAAIGTYTVTMSASNTCGLDTVRHEVTVSSTAPTHWLFLPLLLRGD